jgi:outer membrane receptor protein involved in Fe transport
MDSLLAMSLEELIEVEVTVATGTPKPLKLAPSVATVISAEEIKNIGARNINEALETVPGLHVGVSTKNAMSPIYSMRGIHTSLNPQVLMLMNGIPISMAFTGTRAFFNMPVSSISRIEVIRGPGSAVYGADAFSGTINIITKDGKDIDGTEAGARAGSFDTYDMFVQHGGTYQGWDIYANLEYQTSKGDSSRIIESDLQTVLDGALGTNASVTPASLKTGYENIDMHFGFTKDNWTLRLWGALQDSGNYDGVTNVVTLTHDSDLDINQYLADLTYENDQLIQDFTLTSRLYFMYYKQDALIQLFPDGAVLPIGVDGNINFATPAGATYFQDGVWGEPIQEDKQTGIELTGLYTGFEAHRLRSAIGYKYLREEHEEYKNFGPGILDGSQVFQDGTLTDVTGTENIYAPNKSRQLVFFSLQDEWDLSKNWELVAGVRYDNYSDFGDTVNPRVALIWKTFEDLTTKILYGRAFRPPAFNELYNQNNPSNNGNDNLEPETIQTIEFAADYQPLPNLKLRMNLFYYDIEDLIELVQDPGQITQTSQNSKNQEGQGFELEAELLATKNLLLKGNIAFQDSEDKDTGEPVPDAPEWQAYCNIHWTFMPEWSFNGQYHWIAGRERAVGDIREDIKDNHIVNATVRRTHIFQNWEVALAVRNLFNENLREPSPTVIPNDYPMEERSFWAELRFLF